MSHSRVEKIETVKEKPTPAYIRDSYPYSSVDEVVSDIDNIETTGALFEIKCPNCKISIRAQGQKIKSTYKRLMSGGGCVGCGNKELIIYEVDMSKIAD